METKFDTNNANWINNNLLYKTSAQEYRFPRESIMTFKNTGSIAIYENAIVYEPFDWQPQKALISMGHHPVIQYFPAKFDLDDIINIDKFSPIIKMGSSCGIRVKMENGKSTQYLLNSNLEANELLKIFYRAKKRKRV